MNFVELFCSTQGRVGRGLYWACFGIWLLVDVMLRGTVSMVSAFTSNEGVVAIFFWAWFAFGIVSYFPMTALLVKRLHDIGRSGWWTSFQHVFLFCAVMFVIAAARMSVGSLLMWMLMLGVCGLGMLIVFIFSLLGSDGSNEYGAAH
jgi:uncharacterized membrane protein YhaH (DUF805 family)